MVGLPSSDELHWLLGASEWMACCVGTSRAHQSISISHASVLLSPRAFLQLQGFSRNPESVTLSICTADGSRSNQMFMSDDNLATKEDRAKESNFGVGQPLALCPSRMGSVCFTVDSPFVLEDLEPWRGVRSGPQSHRPRKKCFVNTIRDMF